MKYTQERDASAELLRLVVQKMGAHPAAFTPTTYAVWYEHALGINEGLSRALGDMLDTGKSLDNEVIQRLFERHVSDCNIEAHGILRSDLKKLLDSLSLATEQTRKEADHFGENLESYGNRLGQNPGTDALRVLVTEMVGDTQKMRDSMQRLRSELEERRQEADKLRQDLDSARGEALVDPLTGILNRRGFEVKAQPVFSGVAEPGRGCCLLMIDIDHFKKVNDTHGHLLGDKVICAVAELLKSLIKGHDDAAAARLGGEEFAVMLPGAAVDGAYVLAEQIRRAVESCNIRRLDTKESIGKVTVSLGVAGWDGQADLPVLIDRADQALYASKKQGRNQTTIYSGEGKA